jgi:malonyl-CoA decarboxylase
MTRCLEARGGEISARSEAAALGRAYLALNPTGRGAFLRLLATEFDLDESVVADKLEALRAADTPAEKRWARWDLRGSVVSPRAHILTRFNSLPEGVKFLVDLRADLLPLAKGDPALASLDDDLKGLLKAWFDPDFLQLRRISWNTASGALLEKFIAYEAVHPVESWEDLKDRLDLDRRYFAFFHPRMPEEPLIFLEVALVEGLADSIQSLLDPATPSMDPSKADTAIFYSISNAQRGLAGISFGGFLIKRVVDELRQDFPDLRTFATLSPMPGFRSWLGAQLDSGEEILTNSEKKGLRRLIQGGSLQAWVEAVLADPAWLADEDLEKSLRPILMRLAAQYLAKERMPGKGALDPVAHFHLSNGARIERLNWRGDLSKKGLTQSYGLMVNYLYDARRIEKNHEMYRGRQHRATSSSIRSLLKG